MASPSFRSTQVSSQPHSQRLVLHCMLYLLIIAYCMLHLLLIPPKLYCIMVTINTHRTSGETQQSEIVRIIKRPPLNMNTNPVLTLWHAMLLQLQDPDLNMEDSSLPNNNHKRGQLALYQPSQQQKKTRSTSHSERSQLDHQTLWLGYQAMEAIA